ncbi:hypothetical protein GCM10010399_64300 [Dactylosporangium fulvum]|uniref:Uncharacterized protein n=1 Tax=Dactylosporangium fulvum TaxID=53359 RepID=A0ABY5W8V1_9ACTN|nr:hypothetical protein [Dactylosporangium fulvum]UWP85746.1 hypothetical protein Dfulv_16490 [Dactylosporangium fulvum]
MAMTLRAVLEIPFTAPDPVQWPVATREPGTWLTLDGTCDDLEVGLFAAVVASSNNIPPGELATAKHLIAPGGLTLTDTNTVITPGCCCGLEDWRDWARALDDNTPPWLGHDPTPKMSIGDRVTVWQDTGPLENHAPILSGPYLTLTRTHLADLLHGVHRDLTEFTAAFAAWAARHTMNGSALTATIDTAFAFTAPLTRSAT